jgi:hypothetical protein
MNNQRLSIAQRLHNHGDSAPCLDSQPFPVKRGKKRDHVLFNFETIMFAQYLSPAVLSKDVEKATADC